MSDEPADGLSFSPPAADDGQPALPGFGDLFSLDPLAGPEGSSVEQGDHDGSAVVDQFQFDGFGFDVYQPAPHPAAEHPPLPHPGLGGGIAISQASPRAPHRFKDVRIQLQAPELTTRGGRMLVNLMVENGSEVEFDRAWCRTSTLEYRGQWLSAEGSYAKNQKTGLVEMRLDRVTPGFPRSPAASAILLSEILLPVMLTWAVDADTMVERRTYWGNKISEFVFSQPPGALERLLSDISPCLDTLATTDEQKAGLARAWFDAAGPSRLDVVLKDAGFNEDERKRIIQRWREKSYEVLRQNPYAIVSMGFTVDRAESLVEPLASSPDRGMKLVAHLRDALNRLQGETGSTAISLEIMLSGLMAAEAVSVPDVKEVVDLVHAARRDLDVAVVAADRRNYCGVGRNIMAEVRFARYIAGRLNEARQNRARDPQSYRQKYDRALKYAQAALAAMMPGKPVDQTQAEAVALSAIEPVSVLTGGPGTGKSTVSKALVEVLEKMAAERPASERGKIVLMSPTGQAAIRLAKMSGRESATMHRALGIIPSDLDPGDFEVREHFSPNDIFVVDEASMVDSQIAEALIRAAPTRPGPGFRIILIGDDSQLDPVGPGRPFADILAACNGNTARVPFTRLTKVHRQDDKGGIAIGAARVRQREAPVIRQAAGIASVPDGAVGLLPAQANQVTRVIRREFAAMQERGEDPANTAVVLTPMRKGPGGVYELNAALSNVLNPNGEPIMSEDRWKGDGPIPRVGDRIVMGSRVVQRTRGTDHGTEIVNSATGRILEKLEKGRIAVEFDGLGRIELDAMHQKALMIGYAITIHKSQGSQYPNVFMPVLLNQSSMLENRLLYTGWTRAMNRLLLVGDMNAINLAISSDKSKLRRTVLGKLLEECLMPDPVAMPLIVQEQASPDDLDLFTQSYFHAQGGTEDDLGLRDGIHETGHAGAPPASPHPEVQPMFENMNFINSPTP